jgi:hypothetical protein
VVDRISERLISLSKGWVALAGLAVFLLFTMLVLPGQAAQSEARTGGGRQPDSSFIYSTADLYDMAEAFGPTGRQAYIRARLTFDVVWPLVYAFFLATSISWLAGMAFPPGSRWRRLNLAPVAGLVLDYLENLSTSLVMARYPARTPVADLLAPAFTLLKWVFVGGSFAALLVVLAAAVWRKAAQGRRDRS